MNTQDMLREAFSRALNIELVLVHNDLSYQSIPEWDSISHMVLISEIESVFNVNFETDDVISLSSYAKAKEILFKYSINI